MSADLVEEGVVVEALPPLAHVQPLDVVAEISVPVRPPRRLLRLEEHAERAALAVAVGRGEQVGDGLAQLGQLAVLDEGRLV